MFCKAKSEEKKTFFARRFLTIFKQKCFNLRPLLFITFPQGFRISKNMEQRLREVGGKRRLNGTSKVNTQTYGQTHGQTDGHFKSGPMLWKLIDDKNVTSIVVWWSYFAHSCCQRHVTLFCCNFTFVVIYAPILGKIVLAQSCSCKKFVLFHVCSIIGSFNLLFYHSTIVSIYFLHNFDIESFHY